MQPQPSAHSGARAAQVPARSCSIPPGAAGGLLLGCVGRVISSHCATLRRSLGHVSSFCIWQIGGCLLGGCLQSDTDQMGAR